MGLLAGCSVGPQEAPAAVVAPPAPAGSATTGTADGVPLTVQAYFLRGERLVRISRTVPAGSGLDPSLSALAMPLSAGELGQGLRSAIPVSPAPLQGRLTGSGTAEVSLPPGFDRLSVREQVNAVAQLVFTVTANTIATRLEMVKDGQRVRVPDGSGEIIDRPVTRYDYSQLGPAS